MEPKDNMGNRHKKATLESKGEMRIKQSQMSWLAGAALVCFVVWDRAIHDALLVFDTALYNYSLVLPLAYIVASLVVLALHYRRLDAHMRMRGVCRAAEVASIVSCVAGLGLWLLTGEVAHIVLVAVQVVCLVALLPALAQVLCVQSQRAVGLSAATALLVAMGCVAACRAVPEASMWLIVFAPLGVSACVGALYRSCEQTQAKTHQGEVAVAATSATAATSSDPAAHFDPTALVSLPFPWPLLGMYALCCLVAQFFLGNVVHPFLMSSGTITLYFTQICAVFAIALGVWAAFGHAENVNAPLSVALLLLVAGLVLFATGALQSLILPIGLVAAASDCLYGLSWVLLVYVARMWRVDQVSLFIGGMMVCEGTVGLFTSAFLKRMVVMDYEALTFTSVACIAAFAVFYLCLSQMHTRSMHLVAQEALQNVSRAEQELPRDMTAEQAARAMEVYLNQRADNFNLTPREREVLPLVVQGFGNKEIATQLDMSESTVKYHLRNMFTKCQVSNRSELAELFHT